MIRRDFLKTSGITLASSVVSLPVLSKPKRIVTPFTTGLPSLDELLKTDKSQVLIRLPIMLSKSHKRFIEHLSSLNNSFTYIIIDYKNIDYDNLPTNKYIFVSDFLGSPYSDDESYFKIVYIQDDIINIYNSAYFFEKCISITDYKGMLSETTGKEI